MLQLKEKLCKTFLLAMTYTCKLWPHGYHQVLTRGIRAYLRVHLRSQHYPVLPLHNAGHAADVKAPAAIFRRDPKIRLLYIFCEVITEINIYIYEIMDQLVADPQIDGEVSLESINVKVRAVHDFNNLGICFDLIQHGQVRPQGEGICQAICKRNN